MKSTKRLAPSGLGPPLMIDTPPISVAVSGGKTSSTGNPWFTAIARMSWPQFTPSSASPRDTRVIAAGDAGIRVAFAASCLSHSNARSSFPNRKIWAATKMKPPPVVTGLGSTTWPLRSLIVSAGRVSISVIMDCLPLHEDLVPRHVACSLSGEHRLYPIHNVVRHERFAIVFADVPVCDETRFRT